MTATDELRRMLDERGVEWTYGDGTVSYASDGHWCHAWAYNDGAMCVSMGYFTPDQAIEATLGRGACHDAAGERMSFFSCSACGATIERKHPRFCFACGRKVVE